MGIYVILKFPILQWEICVLSLCLALNSLAIACTKLLLLHMLSSCCIDVAYPIEHLLYSSLNYSVFF
jgi:hypothetical protein